MKCSAVLIHVVADKLMDFDSLAKDSPMNGKEYAAMLSILITAFENKFQYC